MDENALSNVIFGAAIEVHKQLGLGLLESAYEECLAFELSEHPTSSDRRRYLSFTNADMWIAVSDAICWLRIALGSNSKTSTR
jgi:GxxExxY protein